MRHTFLFGEGPWKADGSCVFEDGDGVPAREGTTITHGSEARTIDGEFEVLSAEEPDSLEDRLPRIRTGGLR